MFFKLSKNSSVDAANRNNPYWQTQTDEPLFPDVIWSRPETAHGSGKLAVIGGSSGAMAGIASMYTQAERAGAGTIYLLVPDSLTKVTRHIPHIQYAPSTPSGSFAKSSLSELIDVAERADAVLLAGDLAKNSETSLMLENFINSYQGLLMIALEAFESITSPTIQLLSRENTILCLDSQLFRKILIEIESTTPFTSDTPRQKIAAILREVTSQHPATILCDIHDSLWVASKGDVVDCKKTDFNCAKSAVWAMQQPTKTYQALVSSAL